MILILSIQLQREEPAETPCVHRPPGEAAELGSQLLRGSIRHPHPRAAENRKVLSFLLKIESVEQSGD